METVLVVCTYICIYLSEQSAPSLCNIKFFNFFGQASQAKSLLFHFNCADFILPVFAIALFSFHFFLKDSVLDIVFLKKWVYSSAMPFICIFYDSSIVLMVSFNAWSMIKKEKNIMNVFIHVFAFMTTWILSCTFNVLTACLYFHWLKTFFNVCIVSWDNRRIDA